MGKVNKHLLITLLVPLLIAFSQARLLSAANCGTFGAKHLRIDYHDLGRQPDTPPCCPQDPHHADCCHGNNQGSLADSNSTADNHYPPSHVCRHNKQTEPDLATPAFLQANTPATPLTSSIIAPEPPHATPRLNARRIHPPPLYTAQQRYILHCSFLI